MSGLPESWLEVSFRDVVEINPRKFVDLDPDDFVSFVPMTAVDAASGQIVDNITRSLKEVERGFRQFVDGDVLFAKITPSMENGKSAVAVNLKNQLGFGSTEFHVLRSHGAVLPEYLWRFVRQESFRIDAQKVMSGAVGQQRVPVDHLKEHRLPLPPLAEQKRIVAGIDKLTKHTTTARLDLQRMQALVETYKVTLLTELFLKVEASKNISKLKFNDLVKSSRNGLSKRRGTIGRPINVLRLADLENGRFKGVNPRAITLTEVEEARFALKQGDLVCIRVNGSKRLVGRFLTWKFSGEWAFCDHFIRYSLDIERVIPQFIEYYFSTEKVRSIIETSFVSSAGQKTVNQRMIGEIGIPLPSKNFQAEIVRHIEAVFSCLNGVSLSLRAANKLLQRLDMAILANAFRGNLVCQDSKDEPPSDLLARIREKRAVEQKRLSQRRRKKHSMTKDTKQRLLEDSETWPQKGLPFEELFKRLPLPYDEMRDALFELLGGASPRLRQVFDKSTELMHLQRNRS